MQHINKIILLLAFSIAISSGAHAQSISGIIIDSLSGHLLANATVTIGQGGREITTVNAEKGSFRFAGLDSSAAYELNIRYSGYRKEILTSVKPSNTVLSVYLMPEQKEMAGVTVSSAKPFIEQKNDKITVNVAQSPIVAGGNAYDAVKKAPGITDFQQLQFRGKNVTVYINDKPARLGGEELKNYLSSMPANTVERVEVIPNPSAKYEANGGPVINIILAKSKELGTNGVLTAGAGAGRYPRLNSGLSLNHRTSALNIYGSYDYLQNKTRSVTRTDRSFNQLFSINDEQRSFDKINSHSAKAGLDYTLNKKSTAGILVRGVFTDRNKNSQNISVTSADSSSTVANEGRSEVSTISANIYYKTRIGKTGDLSLNADHFNFNKARNDEFSTRYYDAKRHEYAHPYLLRASAPADNKIQSFSADYAFKANKIRYEAGAKAVLTRTDNTSHWEKNANGNWENDVQKSNRFIYKENVYAAYASASGSNGKFDVEAGLRMEYTNANGYSVTLKQESDNDYISLFPSLSVSFNQSEQQQYSFSYRRRIERFGFDIVNPFIVYQNQYAFYQGNPFIRPSFSDNFSLGWTYGNEWMASVDYGHFTDALAEVYKKTANGDAMISTFENIASADQLSLNISYTKSLLQGKLTTSNSLGGLYAKYNAPAATDLNNAALGVFLNSSNMVSLGKAWRGEMSAAYYSPMQFGAYQFSSQFFASLGFSRTLLQKKATLGISVTDIFNSNKQRYSVASYGVQAMTKSMPETRFIKLNFTYKFGNKNVKAAKNRQTGIDDVKRRMSN
ncbi:MAG: TonB-dependent receptor [Chitinophagaceae bacterium]